MLSKICLSWQFFFTTYMKKVKTSSQLSSNNLKKLKAFEMRYNGVPYEDIAKTLNAQTSTITTYFSRQWNESYSAYAQEQDLERMSIASRELAKSAHKASKTVIELLNSTNPRIRLAAAKEVLDRLNIKQEKPDETLQAPVALVKFI